MEINDKRIAGLREIVRIQCSNGNWNYDNYMHGMANGLLLAEHTILGEIDGELKYLDAPKEWLKDRPKFTPEVMSEPIKEPSK